MLRREKQKQDKVAMLSKLTDTSLSGYRPLILSASGTPKSLMCICLGIFHCYCCKPKPIPPPARRRRRPCRLCGADPIRTSSNRSAGPWSAVRIARQARKQIDIKQRVTQAGKLKEIIQCKRGQAADAKAAPNAIPPVRLD